MEKKDVEKKHHAAITIVLFVYCSGAGLVAGYL
jgi:hypothetical protein